MIYLLVSAVVLAVVLAVPLRCRGHGRHVSRPLRRLLGWTWVDVHVAQVVFLVGSIGLSFSSDLSSMIAQVVFVVWLVDDWLTGDPNKPERKHEWAKVKLRKINPVKLRPAERFRPVPA